MVTLHKDSVIIKEVEDNYEIDFLGLTSSDRVNLIKKLQPTLEEITPKDRELMKYLKNNYGVDEICDINPYTDILSWND